MSTWHQDQAKVLVEQSHPTLWSVWNDGPNRQRSVIRFADAEGADTYIAGLRKRAQAPQASVEEVLTHRYAYVVPPAVTI